VVQGACMQQYAAAVAWVRPIAIDGRQPACVWQQAADGACVQQCAAAMACVWQRGGAASSTIAMEDSDGSRRRWQRKEQQLTATSC
jgi:hypothetical protein